MQNPKKLKEVTINKLARAATLILIALFLVVPACAQIQKKEALQPPTVEVQYVKLRGVTPTTVTIDIQISIDNPNPIGVNLTKLAYETYFSEAGKWVFLGQGERREIEVRAKGITTVDIPYTIESLSAIRAIVEFLRKDRQVDIRISGSVSVKDGPTSSATTFDTTTTVKYELPIPALPKLPQLPGLPGK